MALQKVLELVLILSVAQSCCVVAAAEVESVALDAALLADDHCAHGEDFWNALQLRATRIEPNTTEMGADVEAEALGEPLFADAEPEWDDPTEMAIDSEMESDNTNASDEVVKEPGICMHSGSKRCGSYLACRGRRYCVFGGYMVVPGVAIAGTESINTTNARGFDHLFNVARGLCGGVGCVLITNPLGHRAQDQLHINYRHFRALGTSMKARLEGKTCGHRGWVPFKTGCCGCEVGKARAFGYFPGVFSEVARAYRGRSLVGIGISVWFGCGKTIVLTTPRCSIDHPVCAT